MENIKDWRLLMVIYILVAGVWGVLIKIASTYLNAYTMSFIALTSAWLTVGVISLSKLSWQSNFGIALAAICGFVGGLSSLLLYHLIKMTSASTVIPLCSLYIVVTVFLSYIFLNESIGFKKILGITFGLIAIVLLTTE